MLTETATHALFEQHDAFSHCAENDVRFVAAMREMIGWHRHHSRIYDGICRQYGFEAEQVRRIEDVFTIPHIIVSAFKERKILSLPEDQITRTFTSSGTGGQVSQINWDAVSERRQEGMRRDIIATYGLLNPEQRVNYIVFNFEPKVAGTKGAAYSDLKYTEFAPAAEIFWAIQGDDCGEPQFKLEATVAKLRDFERQGLPIRLIGFPAFTTFTLKHLEEQKLTFRFPPESAMILGGGWKTHSGAAIPFEEFAALSKRVLGIPKARIRDVYGMVEHGVPYITCEENHFHVPIYSRACAVDPGTLDILPLGEKGMLKFVTPYIRSVPAISVLSTDIGEVRQGCACGRPGTYLVLRGRGGVQKYAGCAISAAQLLGQ
mgnify:CR=1 FL=1|uniref:Acyl-protein synthetase n=1 Tax=Desulfatirhabdium butyrativorans TaxID=340467 RepID=A0A7C4RU68_9BACT